MAVTLGNRRRLAALAWLGASLALAPARVHAQDAPRCALSEAFKTLRALLAERAGRDVTDECVEPEWHDWAGDGWQDTTAGAFFWRKATNTVGFTDGPATWLLAADGVEEASAPANCPASCGDPAPRVIDVCVQPRDRVCVNTASTDGLFAVRLPSNPTTVYRWELAEPPDAAVLALVGQSFFGPGEAPGLVGAPGHEVWTFHAGEPGVTALTVHYVRSWEAGQPPAREERLSVMIR